jgi:hypothetical protein
MISQKVNTGLVLIVVVALLCEGPGVVAEM